jgi:hypothetical protein
MSELIRQDGACQFTAKEKTLSQGFQQAEAAYPCVDYFPELS